jgi:hypothetical protein
MSSIAAGTTLTTALVATGDTSGELLLKTGPSATTAVSIDTSGNVAVTGDLTFNNGKAAVTTGKAIAMAMIFGF